LTTKPRERETEEPHQDQAQDARIGAAVLLALGRPLGLRAVHVRRLWGDYYRVNVLTGDAASAAIADSFFLSTDGKGGIVESSPPVVRRYG
jgi:hypothetical protein